MKLHVHPLGLTFIGLVGLNSHNLNGTALSFQGVAPTPPSFRPAPSVAIPQCSGLSAAKVKVQFSVDVSGHPRSIKILETPDEQHAVCVTKMVQQSQFVPATQNGKPFEANVVVLLDVKGTPK